MPIMQATVLSNDLRCSINLDNVLLASDPPLTDAPCLFFRFSLRGLRFLFPVKFKLRHNSAPRSIAFLSILC